MPSARRIRLLFFTTVLALLVIFYIRTGADSTMSSSFYRKTVAHMREKQEAAAQHAERERIARAHEADRGIGLDADGEAKLVQQEDWKSDDRVRDRLKHAEAAAKKSANDAYKDYAVDGENRHAKVPQGAPPSKSNTDSKKKDSAPGAPIPVVAEKVLAGDSSSGDRKKTWSDPDGIPSHDGVAKIGNVPGGSSKGSGAQGNPPIDPAAESELGEIMKRSPVVIFSKSYCPHSKKAKRILLEHHHVSPDVEVVELDTHPHGAQLQELLKQVTGRGTVPNVLVSGRSLGGGSEMEDLWRKGILVDLFKRAGMGKVSVEVLNEYAPQLLT